MPITLNAMNIFEMGFVIYFVRCHFVQMLFRFSSHAKKEMEKKLYA